MPEPAVIPEPDFMPVPVVVPERAAGSSRAMAASAIARSVAASESVPAAPPAPPKPFEERLVEWLTKFGAIIVFLGLAAGASYFWEDIGIWGRVALFAAAGGGMLATGLALEKKERYQLLGRSLVGGGWATLFMTTFGAYHFDAIKVVPSLEIDLALVLVVTAAMVWDTLRYNSRWVTGLAFGLGFYTVAQSHEAAWSLFANVILAAGFIAVVRKRRWYDLEVVGLLAGYANHVLWLRPYVDAGAVPVLPSSLVLGAYWIAFRASYVWREIRDTGEESISSLAAVLNTALLLSVAYYQHTFSAGVGFWAILALGVTEMLIGRLLHASKGEEVALELGAASADRPRLGRSRRTAFLVLSSLGCLLVLAATPVNFVANPRILLWAVSAQAMLFTGYFTGEWLFRRFGLAAALLAAGYALATDGARFMVGIVLTGADRAIPGATALGLLFAGLALVSYLDAHVVPAPRTGDASSADGAGRWLLSNAAWATLVIALYILVPAHWVAVSLGVATCALALIALRLDISELMFQAHVTMALAVADVYLMNWNAANATRVGTFASVAAAAYVAGELVRRYERREAVGPAIGQAYSWLGSGVVAALIFLLTHDWRTAPAWAVFALALGVAGRYGRRAELNWQAFAVSGGAFFTSIAVSLPHEAIVGGRVSTRVLSVSIV
ncbi:MAG TPA: DUF2339 domain-containing protein, partial [Polyangiaceae bacterium]|nr:DUF2339 domain-containing protein [Polyangiaceae bacterium]